MERFLSLPDTPAHIAQFVPVSNDDVAISTCDNLIWKSLSFKARSDLMNNVENLHHGLGDSNLSRSSQNGATWKMMRTGNYLIAQAGMKSHIGIAYLTELEVDQVMAVSRRHRKLVQHSVEKALTRT